MQDNQGRRPSDLARMKGMEDVVRAMDNQKLDVSDSYKSNLTR